MGAPVGADGLSTRRVRPRVSWRGDQKAGWSPVGAVLVVRANLRSVTAEPERVSMRTGLLRPSRQEPRFYDRGLLH